MPTFENLPPRTADDIRRVSEHVAYEVRMLRATTKLLLNATYPAGETRNAVLESFTLHARSLIDFFFPPSNLDTRDIYVWHYIAPDRWKTLRGEKEGMPSALKDIKTRTGTEVAHLSFNRLAKLPDEWDWDVRAIWEAFVPLLEAFTRGVDQALLSTHHWLDIKAGSALHGPTVWKVNTTAESVQTICNTPSANAQFKSGQS